MCAIAAASKSTDSAPASNVRSAPGKQADLVLLKARTLNVGPLNDPVGAIVLGMDTINVGSMFVAGRALKYKGRLLGVNEERLLRATEEAQLALLERAGAPPPPHTR